MSAAPAHPLVRSFLRDAGWAPTTNVSAVSCLNRWTAWLAAHDTELAGASRDDCEAYLAEREAAGVGAATRQVDWRMMRALHRWLRDEEETDRDAMARVKAPRVAETPVAVLTDTEYRAILRTCDRRTTGGRRDEAILSLLWWSGLRRSEVAGVDLAGLDLDARTLDVGSRTFATKNRQPRQVPLHPDTTAAIDRYLRRRGYEPGPLFLSERGEDHADRRLRPNSIQLIIRRSRIAAGITRPVGVHEFRRAFSIRWKSEGGSDPGLMANNGWSSIRMVDRYTRMARTELAHKEYRRIFDAAPTRRRRRRAS